MSVTGIGGLFFRSRDPESRAAWYRTHLGIEAGGESVWQQEPGPTVVSPFPADTEYFPLDCQWMLNLRVTGLDAMIARLERDGIEVEQRPEWNAPGVGRFARIQDPEGMPIELWEPDS